MKTVLLVLCFVSVCLPFVSATFGRQSNSAVKNVFANAIVARKVDVDRQGGLGATLMAGPIFLALSTLLLPFLPLLLIAPIIGSIAPTFGTINEVANDASNPTSPLNEALQAFSSIAGDIGGGHSGSTGSNTGSGSTASASSPSATVHKPPSSSSSSSSNSQSNPLSEGSLLQQLANFATDDGTNEGILPLLSQLAQGSGTTSTNSNNHNPSLQQLAGNALNSISNFLFNNRRSEKLPWKDQLRPPVPFKNKPGVVAYLKDMYNTIKYGLRRYEIKEIECQQRLICELHQKAIGRRMRPMANVVLDSFGIEHQLERSMAFAGRTKTYLIDFYKAVKNGIAEKECAEVYARCPVNIAVEPSNSLFNGIFRRKSEKQKPLEYVLLNQKPAIQSKLTYKPTPVIYMRNPS